MHAMTHPDALLEDRIKAELALCEKAKAEGRRASAALHWEEFVRLIAQRSPKRVRQMEREQGLL